MEHCRCSERKCCRNAEFLSNFDYKDLLCALADKINIIYANNNRSADPLNEDIEGIVLMTQIAWFLSSIKSEFDKKEFHRILDGNKYKEDIPRDLHCSDLSSEYTYGWYKGRYTPIGEVNKREENAENGKQ